MDSLLRGADRTSVESRHRKLSRGSYCLSGRQSGAFQCSLHQFSPCHGALRNDSKITSAFHFWCSPPAQNKFEDNTGSARKPEWEAFSPLPRATSTFFSNPLSPWISIAETRKNLTAAKVVVSTVTAVGQIRTDTVAAHLSGSRPIHIG